MLGDTKYTLFRNVSVICLGCWLVLGMPGRLRALGGAFRVSGGSPGDVAAAFSPVDRAVAAYGVCVVLSALCSSYGKLAWEGYAGWYMGAFSQLMFVGIYFFVSRQYDGAAYPLYIGEAAFALTALLGLLHKLGIDPLGLQTGWNSGDWEYSHMLSTLGNINWLCGYYSVGLAFVLVHFLREERCFPGALLYAASAAAMVLLGIQGSQGGLLILGVGAGMGFLLGWKRREVRRRMFLLLAGFFLGMPLMELLMRLRGDMAAVVRDGNVFDRVHWYVWLLGAAVCLVCCFAAVQKPPAAENSAAAQKPAADGRGPGRWPRRLMALCPWALSAAVVLAWGLIPRVVGDEFGSGRGFLWRIALEGFGQSGGKDRLLGAGPDCYGEAIFNTLGAGTDVWKGEHWEGAVFTNAHNEVLSQLINTGVLGAVCYAAVFLTGVFRYGGMCRTKAGTSRDERIHSAGWLGLCIIAMYGIHSLISFQQVLNTPLLFLALGLCEHGARVQAAYNAMDKSDVGRNP